MAQDAKPQRGKRIAIVGGGISGIACMWGLRDTDCDVHLFESDSRLGGHADTNVFRGNGICAPVDTGFIAMNESAYPQFNAFLKCLKVRTIPTDMSFAVSAKDGRLEWGSSSFWGFFGSLTNMMSLWWLRLVFDIIRFNIFAVDILSEHSTPSYRPASTKAYFDDAEKASENTPSATLESIGGYLKRHRYSSQFIDHYIIPMVAAPWCMDPDEFSDNFPAATLIDFMFQCNLLDTVLYRLKWHTIEHGSKTYVDAFHKSLKLHQRVHLNLSVKCIHRRDDGCIDLTFANDAVETFDHVVLAVHANQALRLLGEGATKSEREILPHFRTTRNTCILHSDESLLPQRHSARASWNCLIGTPGGGSRAPKHSSQAASPSQRISITFDMNRLQDIALPPNPLSPGRVLVSMNPNHEPSPSTQQGRFVYDHPLFSSDSIRASGRLPAINGVQGVSFAGAWMGYGFHEDGFGTGMAAAERLGGGWRGEDRAFSRAERPISRPRTNSGLLNHALRAVICAIQAGIESLEGVS